MPKNKNVENKIEGAGEGTRVKVRMMDIRTFTNYHLDIFAFGHPYCFHVSAF